MMIVVGVNPPPFEFVQYPAVLNVSSCCPTEMGEAQVRRADPKAVCIAVIWFPPSSSAAVREFPSPKNWGPGVHVITRSPPSTNAVLITMSSGAGPAPGTGCDFPVRYSPVGPRMSDSPGCLIITSVGAMGSLH